MVRHDLMLEVGWRGLMVVVVVVVERGELDKAATLKGGAVLHAAVFTSLIVCVMCAWLVRAW